MADVKMVVVGARDTIDSVSVWGYDAVGTLIWTYDTGATTTKVKIVGSDVFVLGYEADNGDGNGTRNIWKLQLSDGSYLTGVHARSSIRAWDIAIDSIDRLIIGTNVGGSRYPLSLASEETFSSGGCLSVAVDLVDNSIYMGSGGISANIRKYASNLTSTWSKTPYSSSNTYGMKVIPSTQYVAFVQSGRRYCYDKDGNQVWAKTDGGGTELVVNSSNELYLLTDSTTNTVRKLDVSTGEFLSGIDLLRTAEGGAFALAEQYLWVVGNDLKNFNISRVDLVNGIASGHIVTPNPVGVSLSGIALTSDFEFTPKELKDDCIAEYKMNDAAASTTVLDSSGNSRHGVASKNTAIMTTSGLVKEALYFEDDDSDEVNLGNLAVFDQTPDQDFTYGIWWNYAGSLATDRGTLIHKYVAIGTRGIFVTIFPDNNQVTAYLYGGGNAATVNVPSAIWVPGWHLVVVRIDRSGYITISVDNKTYHAAQDISATKDDDLSTDAAMVIGQAAPVSANYCNFNGALDIVSIWSRVLTDDEEVEFYNEGIGAEDWNLSIPVITQEPVSQIKSMGDSVTFTCIATQDAEYQWYKDAALMEGEIASTLTFTVVEGTDVDYYCIASNYMGSDTSSTATLSIRPTITLEPVSQGKTVGDTVLFTIQAVGSPVLTYQWYKDDVAISGETSTTLVFIMESRDVGSYTCMATNAYGSDTSVAAILTSAPVITAQSADQVVGLGGIAVLSVTAIGTAPMTYQWYKDSVAISGEVLSSYTKVTVFTSAADYTCKVTNLVGSITSSPIKLTVVENLYSWNPFNNCLDTERSE